jgi:hypothetical protein
LYLSFRALFYAGALRSRANLTPIHRQADKAATAAKRLSFHGDPCDKLVRFRPYDEMRQEADFPCWRENAMKALARRLAAAIGRSPRTEPAPYPGKV